MSRMMVEYFLGQILQNSRIDPLSVKANVMLATRYVDAVEEECKKEDERRQKKYEEERRVEEEKRKQRKIASLKEDIAAQRSSLERQAGYLATFGDQLNTLKARKLSTYAVKANIAHYQQEYIRTSNSLENLRRELELHEPKPANTSPVVSVAQIATPAEVSSGYSSSSR